MSQSFVPSIVIEFPIEAAPRVRICCTHEEEEARVWDWVAAHEELAELVRRALELAQEARAA